MCLDLNFKVIDFQNFIDLEVISNSRNLRFKILDRFIKSKSLTFCKLFKQDIRILITQIQIHVPKIFHPNKPLSLK